MTETKPIHVFATWKVKQGNIYTVLELLKTVTEESVKEPGNLFYKLHQGTADINTLILFEGYEDEAALNEHRNSKHFQEVVIGKIVPLLDNREVVLTTPL
jgi:(4S)-4-hydroxy-5-phosphonooxypentane-2,3-dione isomerase